MEPTYLLKCVSSPTFAFEGESQGSWGRQIETSSETEQQDLVQERESVRVLLTNKEHFLLCSDDTPMLQILFSESVHYCQNSQKLYYREIRIMEHSNVIK